MAWSENSEVLPSGSVAVAVTKVWPAGREEVVSVKLAWPAASVIAGMLVRKVWPSATPPAEPRALAKNSTVNAVEGAALRVHPISVLPPASVVNEVRTGAGCMLLPGKSSTGK